MRNTQSRHPKLRASVVLLLVALLAACEESSPVMTPSSLSNGGTLAFGGCPEQVVGSVFEGTSDGIVPVIGATVSGRYSSAAFPQPAETLTDGSGRYLLCPTLPPDCEIGSCTARLDVRVSKEGYTSATRSIEFPYDTWGYDVFTVPDLQLQPK